MEGSGGDKPPRKSPGSGKRKSGSDDASPAATTPSSAGPSSSSPATRRRSSSSSSNPAVATSAVSARVRDAASGKLWKKKTSRRACGRVHAHADKEAAMREAVLHVRRAHSVLAPNILASPYNEPTPAAAASPAPTTPVMSRAVTRGLTSSFASTLGWLSWVRSAGAGELWNTPGRDDLADMEPMRKVTLDLRRRLSILAPDDPASPYLEKRPHSNISYLSELRKHVESDISKNRAIVPEWENPPSEKDIADYKSDGETLRKMGKVVWPLGMNSTPTYELPETSKATSGKCKCSHHGSTACVKVHVQAATSSLKKRMGNEAFSNCGLDAMGEQTLSLWTKKEKKELGEIGKSIPQNKHGQFMKIASEKFRSKRPKDLANYYYNVFHPRRLASLTRAENIDAKDVDTDDDSNEGHSKKKMKSKGSSRRTRK